MVVPEVFTCNRSPARNPVLMLTVALFKLVLSLSARVRPVPIVVTELASV